MKKLRILHKLTAKSSKGKLGTPTRCSFCGLHTDNSQMRILVFGGTAAICDLCVKDAKELLS